MFYASVTDPQGQPVFVRVKTHTRPDGSTYRMFDCPQSSTRHATPYDTSAQALDAATRYCAWQRDHSNPGYEEAE